jgi:nucleoside-diphosphate-sugar epimerase
MMKIFLTGAFGNVGASTLQELINQNHEILCFDIKNSKNEKKCNKLQKKGQFDTIWGDITNPDEVSNALKDIDVIIHLAAIIPPLSEKNPDLAYKVNVEGTRNLIEAAKRLERSPRFVVASSVSVHGPCMHKKGLRKADEELCPSDHYSHTKVEVEKMLKESGLPWLILRLGAVSIPKIPYRLDPIMFEVPLDQRIEFIDSRDAGLAFANAATVDVENKVLQIGGGESCQIYQREYISEMFNALGIPMLPDSAFCMPKNDDEWFYTDWMDTEEAQSLLNFQTISFEDYMKEFKKKVAVRRFGLRLVAPFAKFGLLMMSPYYKFSSDKSIKLDIGYYNHLKSTIEKDRETIEDLHERIANLESRLKETN